MLLVIVSRLTCTSWWPMASTADPGTSVSPLKQHLANAIESVGTLSVEGSG